MGNKKEYNQYLWAKEQPRVYEASPLAISGTPMSEEDAAMSLKAENLQQSLQQNPIFKSAKQWEEQQKQREKEIAASKKWLELHPEDESDSPYTILERGKHQAIVNGKDPSYYEKMINDGEQFTKGALSVLSLPYLGAAAAGAYGYGASLVARGLFAGQGIYGLADENGVRKTVNLIKSGDYGRAALSGAGDVLNASMILPGAKFLGNVAKYGLKSTAAGEVLRQNVRYAPQIGRRLVVSKDYFKDPTKFYRIGTTPEKLSMEYAGENIVSGSAESLGKVTPADAFRRTVTRNSRIQPGKGANEGYWVLAPEQSNTKVTNLLQKVNSSHGGETQASAGTLWEGGLNSDSRFPSVIFEGTMPETVRASWNSTLGKSIGRSNFIRQPSENLPIGTRLGFKTGEIPIHSTSSFVETSPGSGKFFYNGEIIPENRIFSSQQFSKSNGKTYLGLLERPSKLSEAERLGIPKHERNCDYQFFKSIKERNPALTSYIRTKHFAEQSADNKLTSSFFPKGRTLDEDMWFSADDNLWKYYQNNKKGLPIKMTHKSPNNFYVFDYTRQSKYPDGHFFFSMHDRPQFGKGKISKDFYIYDKNVKPISEYTGDDLHIIDKNTGNYLLRELDSNSANSALLQDAVHNKTPNTIYGYDSGSNFVEGMYEFAVPRNTQMKLVDPITYDNNGHIIKLSKRDNFKNPDFRYKQGGILKRVESGKSGIHIKPENRGKFTALKKRTGKSSTWYKEHGTPAQKKMAVFALNARKWKHK